MTSEDESTGLRDEDARGVPEQHRPPADLDRTRPRPPSAPDFIDHVPLSPPPPVPDQAPIQSFDQRPRFELPDSPAPPAGASGPDSRAPSAPPGVDATASPPRRGLLVPALAVGCALLLLLGIGGGLTGLWLSTRDEAPVADAPGTADPGEEAAGESDPGTWRRLADGEDPAGTTADLRQVLSDNPLMAATLPVPGGCDLPVTSAGKVAEDELQGLLEEGAECLATTWSDALEAQDQPFEPPGVVTYSMDALPDDAACSADSFTATAPRTCLADNTLYWPTEWDPGFANAALDEVAGLYMWHLSYSYAVFALASVSLDSYYGALIESLSEDPAAAEEMRRRYALQLSCISSAAAFQQPWGTRPADRVAEFVLSDQAQGEPATASDPSQASRAHWVRVGHDARGDLSRCDTWSAEADDVT